MAESELSCGKILWHGAEVRFGTSGYSFSDWKGVFYPENIQRGKMLDFYAKIFDAVEINSTYYRILHPKVLRFMVEKTHEDFLFFVKLHGSMTHSRDADSTKWSEYLKMLKPMEESGKLSGLLAQFPYSFKPSEGNMQYLEQLSERVEDRKISVEFRHDAWYRDDFLQRISDMGFSLVSVDLPELPHLPPATALTGSGFGYVRFHGRNAANWWRKGSGSDRYDWEYSREELSRWTANLKKLAESFENVFLFFNNCHGGQAVRSAQLMMDILTEETDKQK